MGKIIFGFEIVILWFHNIYAPCWLRYVR